jgi:peptide/nickel transport system substrate-binding protein
MKRRSFIAAASGLALTAPRLQAAPSRVLRFIPYVDLPVLDPITNTAAQVRNHAFLIWDTLYGLDADYQPHPQMLEGHTIDRGGLEWTLVLRPGLRFHDGEPVLARDVTASLRRWAAVDGFGATLFAATDELAEIDDRTLRFRLNHPFPLLPNALGKMSPNIPAIMPARLAATPPTKQVPDLVGSGPFRFVPDERVPGSRLVYSRFDGYVPRPGGPAGLTSGPKIAYFDRVEWTIMPEPATAAAALQAGEVDWYEAPSPDLLPMLRKDANLVVRTLDPTGVLPILRFNSLYPPFNNRAIRRAVLDAVNQTEFMSAFSDDKNQWRVDVGAFCPGTPMASTAGLAPGAPARSVTAARQAIAAAGYGGETVVVLGPSDHPVNSVMAQVGADLFKRLGLNVDFQAMDAGTKLQRRASREPTGKGGWSCFPSAVAGIDVLDPAVSFLARGNGAKAWYGWPTDPVLEKYRLAWFDAPDLAARRQLCDSIQREILSEAPYAPLGQILQPTAYRTTLTGLVPGFTKFWGVRPA